MMPPPMPSRLVPPSPPPRILLLSQRRLRPSICRTSQTEYEDVITQIDDVHLLAPEPRERVLPESLREIEAIFSRRTGLDLHRRPWPRPMELTGRYDLLFIVIQHPSDLNILRAVPRWRANCRRAIVYIEELWTRDLHYEKMLRPLREFDHVLCNCDSTVKPLQQVIGVPCHFAAVGVDALRFCPWPENPPRVIDCLSMGRRGERTHQALLEKAAAGGFYYEYDTVKASHVLGSQDHRRLLAERIKRARFFLAYPPKIDAMHQRGEQEEIGMRFYEATAGGAVLIGRAPNTPRWKEDFDWPDACIDFPFDSAEIGPFLDALNHEPDRLAAARRANVINGLRKHDWVYRFRDVLRLAGMDESERTHERLRRLAARAGTG